MLIHVRVASGSGSEDGSAEITSVSKSRHATQEAAIGSSRCGRCPRGSTKIRMTVDRLYISQSILATELEYTHDQDRPFERSVRYFPLLLLSSPII